GPVGSGHEPIATVRGVRRAPTGPATLTSVRDLDDTADKTGSASPRPATPPQPSRWLSHPSPLRVVAALAVLVAIGVGIWDSQERDILSGIGTAVATLIAVAVAVLALSIRHGSP